MKLFKNREANKASKKAEKQVENQIHEEKVKNKKDTLKTLAEAEQLFFEGEETIDFIKGIYISVILGSEVQNAGLLIATNQRVLLYGKRPVGYDINSVDYQNITSTSFIRSYPIGQLNINTFGETISFATVMNETGMKMVEIINKRLKHSPDYINVQTTTQEIKNYKELLDMKIINQDEFNAKKAQLLAL